MNIKRYIERMGQRRVVSRGFTLTELLISIAIALILMLGVNQIFKATSTTVGAAQALSSASRDARVVQSTLAHDFRNFASDAGILIIRSEQRYAFRNQQDRQGDSNGRPETVDLAGNPTKTLIPVEKVNYRSHRLDRIGFFDRGNYTRQTASYTQVNGSLTSSTSSSEAWVWYGHLALLGNNWLKTGSGLYQPCNPGNATPDNDNNFFASDWVLGRVATLLMPFANPNQPADPWLVSNPNAGSLDPLIYSSREADFRLADSPLDVANASITNYLTRIDANRLNDWFNPMIGFDRTMIGADGTRSGEYWHVGSPFLPTVPPSTANGSLSSGPRVTAMGADLTSFCMIRGCTQFIVEFAGNYTAQYNDPSDTVNYGNIDLTKPPGPDPDPKHKVDFIVERDATNQPLAARVRWYGFPRSTTGNPTLNFRDVVPVRDMTQGQVALPFERLVDFPNPPGTNPKNYDYYKYLPSASQPLTKAPPAYVCAWDQTMTDLLPKMIRITIAIDEPNGRLGDAQTFEYVFNLQP